MIAACDVTGLDARQMTGVGISVGDEPTAETSHAETSLGPTRLLSLKLSNFRGFSDLHINFPEDGPAVLIGVNGAGKSTVLDAIAMHLAPFAAHAGGYLNDVHVRAPKETDIGVGERECRITARLRVGSSATEWVLSGPPESAAQTPAPFEKAVALTVALTQSRDAGIAVLCSFPATRGLRDRHDTFKRFRPHRQQQQLEAYHGAFDGGLGPFQDFVRWFGGAEDIENEARLRRDPAYRNPQLQAIRHALTVFLNALGSGHFSDLRAERHAADDGSVKTVELSVLKDGTRLGFQQLSEGERNTILLVADIARRLAIANPAAADPLHGAGIVLIDEVDLHLHPTWQRGIVPALSAAFPNLQFIVSTHSPAVLSAIKREHVFVLESFALVRVTPPTYGRDAGSILSEVFGVPERIADVEAKIYRAAVLIDEERIAEAKATLEELASILGEHDAELVRLRTVLSFVETPVRG